MKFNRKGFLKAVFSTPLSIRDSASEREVIKEPVGKFEYDLAQVCLGSAERFLEGLITRKYSGPHKTYASNLDSASRFIHFGVWQELPSRHEVLRAYIPLLEKARDSINLYDPIEIAKHDPICIKNHASYPTFAEHVQACIQGRIYSLKKYCADNRQDTEDCFKRVEREGKYRFI